MTRPDYDLLYIPSLDRYVEWQDYDYYELTDAQKDEAIWMTWDDVTGEWYE